MGGAADLLGGVATLAWPVLVGFIIWLLLPSIRKIIESRAFTITIAGMKVSVQDASEGLRKQVEDLQDQVLALRQPATPDRGAVRTTRSVAAAPKRSKTILWVDDKPQNNAHEIAKLEEDGHRVLRAGSALEAQSILGSVAEPDVIITGMGRKEEGKFLADAGLDLCRTVRDAGIKAPVFVYTGRERARQIHDAVLEAGGNGATSSPVELFADVEGSN